MPDLNDGVVRRWGCSARELLFLCFIVLAPSSGSNLNAFVYLQF